MRIRQVVAVAVFALMVVVLPLRNGVVSAHHSRAHYESADKEVTLTGTVMEYRWRNPHVFVVWSVKDSGKVVDWIGELSSVQTSISDGMTRNSLKPGDVITVRALPARSGTPEALIRKMVKADGTVVVDLTPQNARER